jgi:hypothetical protein
MLNIDPKDRSTAFVCLMATVISAIPKSLFDFKAALRWRAGLRLSVHFIRRAEIVGWSN